MRRLNENFVEYYKEMKEFCMLFCKIYKKRRKIER